jgi:hypothetical protein
MWDHLIEYQSSFIRSGNATSLDGSARAPDDHEWVVRALASESRPSRRELSEHLRHALQISDVGRKFARIVPSPDKPHRMYVFLTIPKPSDLSYDEYREMRQTLLMAYCHGIKLNYPDTSESVGIASEPMNAAVSSQDFLYVDLGHAPMAEGDAVALRRELNELEILQPETMVDRTANVPGARNAQPPRQYGMNGVGLNRAARRAQQKLKRRKRR